MTQIDSVHRLRRVKMVTQLLVVRDNKAIIVTKDRNDVLWKSFLEKGGF